MDDTASTPITADDMARFHRNAPAALERRGGEFLTEQLGGGLESVLTGAVPVIGMLLFDWSAGQLLAFLLIGAWTAILIDFAKFALFHGAVKRFGAVHYDDWHVWVVSNALRSGRREAPRSHLQAKYEPAKGVLADVLFGGVGTATIIAMFVVGKSLRWSELFADRTLLYGVGSLVGYQVLFAVLEMARRWSDRDSGAMKVAVGMRGLGLFLLMFVVVMIRESVDGDRNAARGVMLVVNALIIAWGVFNIVGQIWVVRETRWLGSYLEERGGGARPSEVEELCET